MGQPCGVWIYSCLTIKTFLLEKSSSAILLGFFFFFYFFNSSSLLIAFPIPVLGLYGNWFYLGQFKFGAATWMGWIWMETTQMSALWTAIQVSNQSNHNLNWSTWAWVGVDCFDFGCYLVILLCILYMWTSVLIGKIIGTQCNLNCSSTPYDMFWSVLLCSIFYLIKDQLRGLETSTRLKIRNWCFCGSKII